MTDIPVTPRDGEPRADWRFGSPAEIADHLRATPTISDAAWTREQRRPGEARPAFIERVLGERS